MKKLLLIVLMFLTFNTYSQTSIIEHIDRDVIGIWKNTNTSYYLFISPDYNNKLKFISISWLSNWGYKDQKGPTEVKQYVVNKDKNSITTILLNKTRDYKVTIVYKIIDKNTLELTYNGDYKGIQKLYRYNLNKTINN
tara:strand:+ start:280 stop:693 length:414 start_codon:yes stop_codon:yes gene_type:complete